MNDSCVSIGEKRLLSRAALSLFILFFSIIFITVILDIVRAGYFVSFLIAFLIAGLYLHLCFLLNNRGQFVISDSLLNKLQITAHVLSFIVMLVMVWYGQVKLTWDWGQLIHTASCITLKNYNDNPNYYLRYPNNQFWLAVLTVYFKVVHRMLPSLGSYGLKLTSSLLSVFLIRISILCIYYSAKKSFGKYHAFLLDIALLFFSPLYLYAGFAYTDTSGLLCVSLLILLYLKLRSATQNGFVRLFILVLYALTAALTFRVKVMSFIVFLAACLGLLFQTKIHLRLAIKELAATVLFCSLFIALLSLPIRHITLLPDDKTKAREFPPVHFIVMGFNDYGGYSQDDVDFSSSFDSYEARKEALQQRLIERLEGRTLKENLHFIFYTKLNRTWGNSLLAGDDYMSRSSVFPESLVERFYGWYGDLHDYCKIPAFGFYLVLIAGCLLNGIFSWKAGSVDYLHFSLIGVFLFLSIWECNSRYLFTFTPILFLCSYEGWKEFSALLYDIIDNGHDNQDI